MFYLRFAFDHRSGDIERGYRHITGVGYLDRLEGRYAKFDVVTGPQMPRGLPDRHRAKPGTRPVGGSVVEGNPEDRHVVVGDAIDFREPGEGRGAGEAGDQAAIDWSDWLG